MQIKNILALAFFGLLFYSGYGQIAGCTDSQAQNYNASATINNGSCIYPITAVTPNLAYTLPNQVKETSGLVVFNGKLWTFNDSGGEPILYAIDTTSHQIVQQITVSSASNVDWEDITMDDEYLYVGDMGNNSGVRDDLVVYKILKTSIPINGNSSVQASAIKFSYADQKLFSKTWEHNYDCESIISAGDSLYLFTKNRADQYCHIYSLPKEPGTYAIHCKDRFNTQGLITGADYDASTGQVLLTGYTSQAYIPFVWLLFDFPNHDFFGGNKRRIELQNTLSTQVEGVTFYLPRQVLLSAEKSSGYSARVFKLNLSTWTGFTDLNETEVRNTNPRLVIIENPVKNKILKLEAKHFQSDFKLDIMDSTGRLVKQVNLFGSHEKEFSVDVSQLISGTYFMSAIISDEAFHATFIIP